MKRLWTWYLLTISLVFALSTVAAGQARPADVRSFELRSVLPPTPALKYRLLFDPIDRRSGNAAIQYMQASMMISPELETLQDKATDALSAKDDAAFRDVGHQVLANSSSVADLADLAGRCEGADWQTPVRERGIAALLPHLNRMRLLANVLRVRATMQARDGKIDDAIATLRMGYELARKVGDEPVLISGLVSLGIVAVMNEATIDLMNRPDAPNLYWALVNLPRPMVSIRHSMDGERLFLIGSVPALGRARTNDELSGEDWREVMRQMTGLAGQIQSSSTSKPAATGELASAAAAAMTLPTAQAYYARTRHLTIEQVAKIDPLKVDATYFFEQYESYSDDFYKLLGLPYEQMLPRMDEVSRRIGREREATPLNVFLTVLPALGRAAATYARIDRQIAALTAIEAIRSYGASHNGKLPDRLQDITDTPAPLNPITGAEFEYELNADGTATLRDSQTKDLPLEYSVKVK